MLTELEDIGGVFLGSLVPSTVDFELSPDDMNTNLFFDSTPEKHGAMYLDDFSTNSNTFESQSDQLSDGSPVNDLLDLEDIQTSWRSEESNDPDWIPEIDNQITRCTKPIDTIPTSHSKISPSLPNSLEASQTSRNNTSSNNSSCSSKPSKRRSTSSTSELELQIEIEQSTKRAKRCTAPLTEEEKKARRKELNRLAAQRCRSKRKGHAEVLEEEINVLTKKNRELKARLEQLTTTKDELYEVIKFHFSKCHGGPSSSNESS